MRGAVKKKPRLAQVFGGNVKNEIDKSKFKEYAGHRAHQ